jgi:hypothetical protein
MTREIGTRTQIALLIYSTLNVALFTAGVYVVMLNPSLTDEAGFWIAVTMAVGLLITAPFAWCAASCLCGNRWRDKFVAVRSPHAGTPTREI